MTLYLRYAARSDVGLIRSGNEDSGYAGPHLLVVADGMGGHAAGEVASAAVARVFAGLEPLPDDGLQPDVALRDAIARAGDALRELVLAEPELEGMGTTVTALLLSGDLVGVAQVGDSRAYLLRDGVLEQLTHDQTLVQSLIDEGRISQAQAESHPQRSVLLQALDGRVEVEPEISLRTPRVDDRYLVCSDGLSGVLSDATLRDVLAQHDPAEAVERLVDLARRAGAPDNVTCVVAEVTETDDGEQPQPAALLGAAAEATETAAAETPPAAGGATDGADDDGDDDARGHRLWVVLPIVLLLAALAAGAVLGYSWTQSQYYVGAENGQVVIYQGVSQQVLGRSLSRVAEPSDIDVATLPLFAQEQIQDTITADDLAHARQIVSRLQDEAAACARTPAPSGCPSLAPTATPSPTPTALSTASTTASAAPSPAASASR
jgi:protein phosphatase